MRRWEIGLLLLGTVTVAWGQGQPPSAKPTAKPLILSGTVNLVAAANGGTIVKFTSQLDDSDWGARNLIDGKVWDGREPKTGSNGWASKDARFPQEITFAFRNREIKLINRS